MNWEDQAFFILADYVTSGCFKGGVRSERTGKSPETNLK